MQFLPSHFDTVVLWNGFAGLSMRPWPGQWIVILGVMDDREVLFCIRKSLDLENSPRAVCLLNHHSHAWVGASEPRETACSEFHCKELNSVPKSVFSAFFNVMLFYKRQNWSSLTAPMTLYSVSQPSIRVPVAVRVPFTCGTGMTKSSFLTLMEQ